MEILNILIYLVILFPNDSARDSRRHQLQVSQEFPKGVPLRIHKRILLQKACAVFGISQ
ncbi:MAG: hypothetical protein OEX98_00745 [Nitrosopumilus sp.]|nr:hypothetical protein [Nitrosopumilus sp.]